LALAWWGNPTRNKNTEAEIQAFQQANPNITLAGQPGDFASYWDKLATQTAGGQAPDIIQMDMAYISEYGNRGALLDLEKNGADTSKFIEGTVESGRINGQLVGVNAGINSAVIVANPKIFEKAKMDVPDDKTWTWDQLSEVAAEVASKANVPFGLVYLFGGDPMFGAYLRQNGKELFTEKDVGFEPADAQAWFDLMMKFQKAGGIGTPQQISEEGSPGGGKPIDQSAIVLGRAALQYQNSNQLEALNAASGESLKLLRAPSLAGKAPNAKPGTRRACCGRRRPRPRTQRPQSPGSTGSRTPRRPSTSTRLSAGSRRTPNWRSTSGPSSLPRSRRSRNSSPTSSPSWLVRLSLHHLEEAS